MFPKEVYIKRRSQLREIMKDGIALVLGNPEAPMNYADNVYHYRQDSTFLYFFGIDHPGFAGVFDIDNNKDYIFGNDVDIDDIIWMGPQPSVADQAARFGVENTAPFNDLKSLVAEAIKEGRKIHFLPVYRAENKILIHEMLGTPLNAIKENVSEEFVKAIISLREIKDEYEIKELERAAAIGYEIHTTAMKMAKDGVYEREIAGECEAIALRAGGLLSFPAIVSRRGETLHNHEHGNLLKAGDLLLVDSGAETDSHYASDNTRTIPVGGKFSQKQKEIYEIVLAGINKGNELIRPWVTYQSIHLEVCKVLAKGLKEVGLMKGDIEEAVKAGAHALFMPHGLGHMMGLDVHDMENFGENLVGYDEKVQRIDQFGTAYLRLGKELKPGFVITNEPGIYFIPALMDKWKQEGLHLDYINYDKVYEYRNFGGIRLEDDVLVTEQGNRLIGKRIPISIEEVEKIMR
ncbi:aminopeptidase P family protein [Labilibaculum manganireducens]|uniref:Xaa-Pro aminopeptidase n=1 Tax=Labilibaculum manganireducens TaxID=1940525 RepID=A0A2N3HV51_9BACT|nr:aminopeptidase P family protein [Labilibaculum manganireducens]PKQ61934.1 Xaa-Pro aminopeptidase [Labilibaculum manganireducens]